MGPKSKERLEANDASMIEWMQNLEREQLLQLAADLARRRTQWTLRWQDAERECTVLRERIVRLEKRLLALGAYEKDAEDLFRL